MMGRKREKRMIPIEDWLKPPKSHVRVGSNFYARDRGLNKVDTVAKYDEFVSHSKGAVADYSYQLELFDYGADGTKQIEAAKVKAAADGLKGDVIAHREYPKETITRDMEYETGASGRAALLAKSREQKAKAQAILLAAKVGKVQITADQRGYLNAAAAGRYWDRVYGDDGKYERGTLSTRLRGVRKKGGSYRDPSHYARTEELRDRLRESGASGFSGKSTLNPFSTAKRANLDEFRASSW